MITQKFPFLIPLRTAQRRAFFYAAMRFDGNTYSDTVSPMQYRYMLFSAKHNLYNMNTGFDIVYQENKIHNMRLLNKKLNRLLIKPGETYSFWKSIKGADKDEAYKDGLTVINGKLTVDKAGGLCQMSNMLFWLFLHSPLDITERHTHKLQEFHTVHDAEPDGVDSTVSEGWLDLKVKNNTDFTFQLLLSVEDDMLCGSLMTNSQSPVVYEVEGRNSVYVRVNGQVHQRIAIFRVERDYHTGAITDEKQLYVNTCRIGYELPSDTVIEEE